MISNIQNIPVVWETSKIFHLHEKYPKYFICMRNKWTMNLTTHDCLNLRIFRQGEHCICSGNGLAMSALYPEMRWGVLLMCCSPTFLDYSAFWMKILARWESLSFKILPLEVSSTTLCVNKIDKDWIQNPANIFRLAFSPPIAPIWPRYLCNHGCGKQETAYSPFFLPLHPFSPWKDLRVLVLVTSFCIALLQSCNREGNIQV